MTKAAKPSVWAKDQAFAPDGQLNEFAPPGTKFIIKNAEIVDPVFETEIGTAPMMHLTVATLTDPDAELIVSSIGDTNANKFFDKDNDYASRLAEGDFPAIVETREVPSSQESFSNAFVIRYVDTATDENIKKYSSPF